MTLDREGPLAEEDGDWREDDDEQKEFRDSFDGSLAEEDEERREEDQEAAERAKASVYTHIQDGVMYIGAAL